MVAFLAVALGWSQTKPPLDNVVEWNRLAVGFIRLGNYPPPLAARHLAMLHTAQFEAVNSIRPTYRPYQTLISAPPRASEAAAVAAAGYHILKKVTPMRIGAVTALYQAQVKQAGSGADVEAGIEVGKRAAEEMLASRAQDRAYLAQAPGPSSRKSSSRVPGVYRDVEHVDVKLPLPKWGEVKPFLIAGPEPFRPELMSMSSNEYAGALAQVQAVGHRSSTTRTKAQTESAYFWSLGSDTVSPVGAWNLIASFLLLNPANPKPTLLESCRLFATLNIALADAGIVAWDCKYRANLWRPETAIRLADQDPYPSTHPDPHWEPLLPTPNHPSYVSGHSVFSRASATVLERFFPGRSGFTYGGDPIFSKGPRTFQDVDSAATEAGLSRIYGGIHFSFDDRSGQKIGRAVAEYTLAHFAQPN